MATDLIRYDLLVQDALRGVVRTVLTDAARNGLQGDHHFFITFKTGAPGLRLSDRMRERYPDEMTIILQHQFWDLAVTEHGFEVGLSFSNKPERLLVPFAAITSFHDPSVQFGLKFDLADAAGQDDEDEPAADAPSDTVTPLPTRRALAAVETLPSTDPARIGRGMETKGTETKGTEAKGTEARTTEPKLKPVLSKVPAESPADPAKGKPDGEPTKVVSIDAFRKKP